MSLFQRTPLSSTEGEAQPQRMLTLQPRQRNRSDSVSSIAMDCLLLQQQHSSSSCLHSMPAPLALGRASSISSQNSDTTIQLELNFAELSFSSSIKETPRQARRSSSGSSSSRCFVFTPPPGGGFEQPHEQGTTNHHSSKRSHPLPPPPPLFTPDDQSSFVTIHKRLRTHSELVLDAPRLPTSPDLSNDEDAENWQQPPRADGWQSRPPSLKFLTTLPARSVGPPFASAAASEDEDDAPELLSEEQAPPAAVRKNTKKPAATQAPPPPILMPTMATPPATTRTNALKMRKAAETSALYAPY